MLAVKYFDLDQSLICVLYLYTDMFLLAILRLFAEQRKDGEDNDRIRWD